MSPLYGIRVRLWGGVQVWAGFYLHRYAFARRADAWEFANGHWSQFSAGWRRRRLSVAPLPPFITVPGHYLTLRRSS